MKKILTLCFLLSQIITHSQEIINQLNSCASDEANKVFIANNPAISSKIMAFEDAVKNHKPYDRKTSSVYKIPVIVHVMHKGEAVGEGTNISEDAIKAEIRAINEEYRKISGSLGDGAGVDMEFEFVLTLLDPNGQPSTGIIRYDMTSHSDYMSYGVKLTTTTGMSDVNLKALSYWDSHYFYNIWIVSETDNNNGGVSGVQGVATYASQHGLPTDGMIVLSNSFKDISSRTTTHELGHALNLYHTFEGDRSGSTPICPTGNGDFCADTAPHKRENIDCSIKSNPCDPSNTDLGFLNNYMSYSLDNCRNMFTADQKNRVITAITTTRNSFLSDTSTKNLIPTTAPVANFFPSEPVVISVGNTIQVSDSSTGVPNDYLADSNWTGITSNWNITDGETTLTSTQQNAKLSFNVAGIYSVSHDINNGFGSSSKSVNQLIHVINPLAELPSETLSSTKTGNYGNTISYVKFNTISRNTDAAVNTKYTDFTNSDKTLVVAGNTYPLKIYIKSGTTDNENYAVYIDYDANGTFDETEKVGSGKLAANTALTSTTAATVIVPATATKNKLLRMRVAGNARDVITNDMINGKAPFYIGDTKDFGVYIIDKPQSLGTEEVTFTNLNFYPNPVKDIFNIGNSENIDRVEIYNIMGQLVMTQNFQNTNVQMNLSTLVRGTYIATVYASGKKATIKVLKN